MTCFINALISVHFAEHIKNLHRVCVKYSFYVNANRSDVLYCCIGLFVCKVTHGGVRTIHEPLCHEAMNPEPCVLVRDSVVHIAGVRELRSVFGSDSTYLLIIE